MNVVIIDNEIAAVKRLKSLLQMFDEIDSITGLIDPQFAIKEIVNKKPDIVFCDVEMPNISGFDLVSEIRSQGVDPKIVFVTAYNHYAIKAIKEFAFDYMLKPVDINEIKNLFNRIAITKKSTGKNIISFASKHNLTERETEVVEYLLQGLSSKEIGEKLYMSKHTVDSHRRNILSKTDVKNTNELIVLLTTKELVEMLN
ncbi:MAG: response regulator transcription factor [Bacteroidetes bacterium]|jgi:DNA-binding NarL/FixJ family response regulator|nr:response regulator transcription factor [Bacteroidota bacterium]MBT6687270.1 response regulator transcription factor [Bacteroidota bacterium]MBT7144886.1 response regulator transcription factor [Bacteroidota bacterium]MBT7492337.1 response regulator transcription factor [Bacteroidota bacterium]